MRYSRFSAIFFKFYDVMNHVQSKNISRWPILEYQSQAVELLESEEKIEIRQFVSFLQVFPYLLVRLFRTEWSFRSVLVTSARAQY